MYYIPLFKRTLPLVFYSSPSCPLGRRNYLYYLSILVASKVVILVGLALRSTLSRTFVKGVASI